MLSLEVNKYAGLKGKARVDFSHNNRYRKEGLEAAPFLAPKMEKLCEGITKLCDSITFLSP